MDVANYPPFHFEHLKGDRKDDFMTYEVQREMGIATIIDRYFGVWNIA